PASIVKLPNRGMASDPEPAQVSYLPWLPYWAVMEADFIQVLRSWVYRSWVLVVALTAIGLFTYRWGLHHEAKIIQPASHVIIHLMRGMLMGSVALVGVIAAGAIAAERGSLADSILSRGISRHQYYLGKWHGRLLAIMLGHALLGAIAITGARFVLHEDVTVEGGAAAVAMSGAMLAVVVSLGVMMSALFARPLAAAAALWVLLYAAGVVFGALPHSVPTPEWVLQKLPYVLKGEFTREMLVQVGMYAGGACIASAVVGMFLFSRKDI
ncbi:MAG: hypothetical protein ACKO9Z_11305, partial [Planctomycetota bacterium]